MKRMERRTKLKVDGYDGYFYFVHANDCKSMTPYINIEDENGNDFVEFINRCHVVI